MRWLRFRVSGLLVSVSLRIMPSGRVRDVLMDHLDEWFREVMIENDYDTASVRSFSVTRRYR